MGKKDRNNQQSKSNPFDIISIIVSILAFGFSIWSLFSTNQNSRDLLEYQISEGRLPIVTGLNYELTIQLQRLSDSVLDNTLDYDGIPNTIHPLQIPLYNIGTGIAQNCKAEWDEQSIQDACTQVIDLLVKDSSVRIEKFSYKHLTSSSWYLYDYVVNIEDDEIITIMRWNGSTYIKESLDSETVRLPYLQSLTNDAQSLTISLPRGLSLLLLEMANQEIKSSITIYLKVSYQDIVGKEFMHNYAVTFQPTIESKSENNVSGYIYVLFEQPDVMQ